MKPIILFRFCSFPQFHVLHTKKAPKGWFHDRKQRLFSRTLMDYDLSDKNDRLSAKFVGPLINVARPLEMGLRSII